LSSWTQSGNGKGVKITAFFLLILALFGFAPMASAQGWQAPYISVSATNPTNINTQSFDAVVGTLVYDKADDIWWHKTTSWGDNSGFTTLTSGTAGQYNGITFGNAAFTGTATYSGAVLTGTESDSSVRTVTGSIILSSTTGALVLSNTIPITSGTRGQVVFTGSTIKIFTSATNGLIFTSGTTF
jgi:hypothetical protein